MTRGTAVDARPSARSRRSPIDIALDASAWVIATVVGVIAVAGGMIDPRQWLVVLIVALCAAGLHVAIAFWLSLYSGRFARGSFAELTALLITVLCIGALVALPATLLAPGAGLPSSAVIVALPLALLLLGAIRYGRRLSSEGNAKPNDHAERALIYGAGDLGRHLLRTMIADASSAYSAVGFVDDDPALLGVKIERLRVMGRLDDLGSIVASTGATVLVVSIARADNRLLTRVSDLAQELGIRVLVFPSLEEVLEGKSRLRDVRELSIEDLIGRQPVNTDVESMAGYLRGKRIVVTGAGGSIGSELCRQISKYSPAELVLLDRDETGLQTTQLLLEGNGLLMNENIVLADIRDGEALRHLFLERRPQVVFHAAALKHLPMLERFPGEAWKTNVIGTLNVLNAAQAVGVETFVNISTDKAANATSVLGHSKRLAERLTAWAASATGKRYLSVRFGNVLGSRGSLVPVFAAMIEAGGPLLVTDRDVTRFFMSIPEACHLVVQAGGIGGPGEVLILDMGEPVRILDIAERMIAQSGRDVGIVFTGLREGEKLHEELISDGELVRRPVHPKISHSTVAALDPADLDEAAWNESHGSAPR